MFTFDAGGNFKSLSEGSSFVSKLDGKPVIGISQDGIEIDVVPNWKSESSKNYVVRLTKNIILRSRISCEFLVWF